MVDRMIPAVTSGATLRWRTSRSSRRLPQWLHTNTENTVIPYQENELRVTISIGIVYPLEDTPARAGSVLYKAKNGGCDRMRLFGE